MPTSASPKARKNTPAHNGSWTHTHFGAAAATVLLAVKISKRFRPRSCKSYRKFSRENVYSYDEHVKLAESLDKDGRLPSTFMVVAPGSWDMTVWDDINRMKTLNTSQSQRRQQMHVCPLQIDIVERLINRYSNPGDLVADPFAGLFTVPYEAVKMGRVGKGVELNPDYFRDGVGYLEAADAQQNAPTLFDLLESMEGA